MANIRIIEIEQSELTPEQLAIINAGGVVFDETSQWKYTSSMNLVKLLIRQRSPIFYKV